MGVTSMTPVKATSLMDVAAAAAGGGVGVGGGSPNHSPVQRLGRYGIGASGTVSMQQQMQEAALIRRSQQQQETAMQLAAAMRPALSMTATQSQALRPPQPGGGGAVLTSSASNGWWQHPGVAAPGSPSYPDGTPSPMAISPAPMLLGGGSFSPSAANRFSPRGGVVRSSSYREALLGTPMQVRLTARREVGGLAYCWC